eukprot:SAG31_NODE_308_length_17951_cov_4.779240_12_plen_109_part_00
MTFKFNEIGPLGITFISESSDGAPPIIIKQLSPTGLAAKQSHGMLKRGLQLLSVNGKSVAQSHLKPAIASIKGAGRPLTLQLSATPVVSSTIAVKVKQHHDNCTSNFV